jgi:hypothetical protein
MKKQISFPDIGQYINTVYAVKRYSEFTGLDENGDPTYDESLPKPTIRFDFTVKLHGTNLGVCMNDLVGMWVQSKESIISIGNDNAGSALFCERNKSALEVLFNQIKSRNSLDLSTNTITIYAEWVGKGIQKGVAINNLDKSMFIIGVKITPHPKDGVDSVAYWVDSSNLRAPGNRIYNINDYKTYTLDIDFNDPASSQQLIDQIVKEVETECPVGKAFGFSGIGEGIVGIGHLNGQIYRFKAKGDKHAGKPKDKPVASPIDIDRNNKISEVVDKITPTWRLDQMLTKACHLLNGGAIHRRHIGEYIKLVINDIIKEELETIKDSGFELKELNKKISAVALEYFLREEKESLNLA